MNQKKLCSHFGGIIKEFCTLNFYEETKRLIQTFTFNNSPDVTTDVKSHLINFFYGKNQTFYQRGIMTLLERLFLSKIFEFSFLILFEFKIRTYLISYPIVSIFRYY